jgi:hypothetical protein
VLSNLFSPLLAKIMTGVSLALALALGVQTLRVGHYRAKAEACATARENDRRAYAAAAKEAEAKAIAQKIATENRYAELARESDARAASRERMLAGAAAYAQRHRVRAEAVERAPGQAGAPGEADTPAQPDGPAPASEMVAVARPEFDELVAAAIRAEENRQWAESLIRENLAIPEAQFGSGGTEAPTH